MKITALCPELVEKLIVIDMSPMLYEGFGHKDVFNGLFAVKMQSLKIVSKPNRF